MTDIPILASILIRLDGGIQRIGEFCGCGGSRFHKQIREAGLSPTEYLKAARAAARRTGYTPSSLDFSDDSIHKLQITAPDGRVVRFGRVGYGDFLLWSALEAGGKAPTGKAAQKRRTFRKSHMAIKGDWKNDRYSPNWLAIRILW
jgi:hypothetical protein